MDTRYEDITKEELVSRARKARDYSYGGDTLGNFKRVGSIMANYPGLNVDDPEVVALTYMMKQLDCILWATAKGFTPEVDSKSERYKDVYTYAKLARMLYEEKTHAAKEEDSREGYTMVDGSGVPICSGTFTP